MSEVSFSYNSKLEYALGLFTVSEDEVNEPITWEKFEIQDIYN